MFLGQPFSCIVAGIFDECVNDCSQHSSKLLMNNFLLHFIKLLLMNVFQIKVFITSLDSLAGNSCITERHYQSPVTSPTNNSSCSSSLVSDGKWPNTGCKYFSKKKEFFQDLRCLEDWVTKYFYTMLSRSCATWLKKILS